MESSLTLDGLPDAAGNAQVVVIDIDRASDRMLKDRQKLKIAVIGSPSGVP
jgi:hypothetical protein